MTLEVNRIYNEDCIGERGMALIADGSGKHRSQLHWLRVGQGIL